MKLLHVDSSILAQNSASRDVSADAAAALRGRHPGLGVIRLEADTTPIGHPTAAHLAAAQGAPVDARSVALAYAKNEAAAFPA